MSTTRVYGAMIERHAEIVADASDLKANSEHYVDEIRRAERDALAELAEGADSVEEVDSIELPSDRLGEPDDD